MCEAEIAQFNQTNAGMPFDEMIAYKMGMMERVLDQIYSHYDAFKLLATRAEGGAFSAFIHRIADLEANQAVHYIEAVHSDALSSGRLSLRLLHTLAGAYWTGVFEIVVRDMPREEAEAYYLQLKHFFRRGWEEMFEPQDI